MVCVGVSMTSPRASARTPISAGHLALLDGCRGHADTVSPVTQHDFALLGVFGDAQGRTVTTSVGNAEVPRVHRGIMNRPRRRLERFEPSEGLRKRLWPGP